MDSSSPFRPSRSRAQPKYVEEDSSDSNQKTHSKSSTPPPVISSMRPPKRKSTSDRLRIYNSIPPDSKRQKGIRFRKESRVRKPAQDTISAKPHSTGKTPPWESLEHFILLDIVQRASYPLYEKSTQPNGSIEWLLQISLLSKSFHAAAISALLYCPPLYTSHYAHRLLRLLSKDQNCLSTNYRNKIRRLDIDVRSLIMRRTGASTEPTSYHQRKFSLTTLLSFTARLEGLHLTSHLDEIAAIWAQPQVSRKVNFSYDAEIFNVLDRQRIRLISFSWNGRFPEPLQTINIMEFAHRRFTCLKTLRSICVVNLILPKKSYAQNHALASEKFLLALKQLPELSMLSINKCDVIGNGSVLAALSCPIRRLVIMKCGTLTSEGLCAFLRQRGKDLRILEIIGAQACDGGFLHDLKTFCPLLTSLTFDCSYTDVTSFHDIEPHYNDFLPLGNANWPESLVEIDITNLRNINAVQLEDFLQSLTDCSFINLQRLSIKAILKTSDYRVRARIRNRWREKLLDHFLHIEVPPKGLIHVAAHTSHDSDSSDTEPQRKPRATDQRKSIRLAKQEQSNSVTSGTQAISRNATTEVNVGNKNSCKTVVFQLDDQRPSQNQFVEEDFLDDEISGDEDWAGKDVDEDAIWAQ